MQQICKANYIYALLTRTKYCFSTVVGLNLYYLSSTSWCVYCCTCYKTSSGLDVISQGVLFLSTDIAYLTGLLYADGMLINIYQ
jgi:hypothetical protein